MSEKKLHINQQRFIKDFISFLKEIELSNRGIYTNIWKSQNDIIFNVGVQSMGWGISINYVISSLTYYCDNVDLALDHSSIAEILNVALTEKEVFLGTMDGFLVKIPFPHEYKSANK